MSTLEINLPHWVQINLAEEENTPARMAFILELLVFIERNGIDICGIYRGVKRIYFSKKGAYLAQHNGDRPWRYNGRGLAQAKFELLRLKAKRAEEKQYHAINEKVVVSVAQDYAALGWGHGCSTGEFMLEEGSGKFRIFRRGRWYSLEPKNVQDMLRRAKKAEFIMNYLRRQYSAGAIPNRVRYLFADPSKLIRVREETGEIDVAVKYVSDSRVVREYRHFPATPAGIHNALLYAETAVIQWVSAGC